MALTTIFRAQAWAWLLLPLLLLAGCCADNVCNCEGEAQADAVHLVFDPASFSGADLDTLVVQRYPKNKLTNVTPDVVTIVRPASQSNRPDTLTLNNSTPFPQQGTTKLDGYAYRVRFLSKAPGRRPNAALALTIDSVKLKGSLNGDGCCTCYSNSYKGLYLRAGKDTATTSPNKLVVLSGAGVHLISR